jgi:hypothetical protein
VDIFLYGAINNILGGAVVTKMNHFGSSGLNQASHDIDGGIVSIEQGGGSNDSYWPCRGGEAPALLLSQHE